MDGCWDKMLAVFDLYRMTTLEEKWIKGPKANIVLRAFMKEEVRNPVKSEDGPCCPLIMACKHYRFDLVRQLIMDKADVNRVWDGSTALSYVSDVSNPSLCASRAALCSLLLEARADPNKVPTCWQNVDYGMVLAEDRCEVDIFKMLVDAKADINVPTKVAVCCQWNQQGHGDVYKDPDFYNLTPLQAAVINNNHEFVRYLLEAKANPLTPLATNPHGEKCTLFDILLAGMGKHATYNMSKNGKKRKKKSSQLERHDFGSSCTGTMGHEPFDSLGSA